MTDTSRPLALITGASRGLGFALSEALAETHHIIAVARTVGGLEELDDRIQSKGGSATLAPMDITKADAMAQLCRSVHDRWGQISLWVHTAVHAGPLSPVDHLDAKDWKKSVAINLDAMSHLVPYISPLLKQDGTAVFFDDPHGGEKFFGHYGTTKSAQISLARSWQAETESIGPKVKVVSPRPMATHVRARFFPGEDRSALALPADEAARLLPEILSA
ncbi:SDR family oxidoreductase [Marivita sp. XM-24bin2]|jgi:NAD(P)-dependent dehydrogenase (short-subunit alcohol dehydrogenase family)|uniref:SDR family NAD(P)-dependent oxidoreductase n=1 Tax=unclassified Marivita TaxID=2632480 RepID=UPI000D7B8A34|nr:SDR family oxidoreductase [Marivita sp. XM-24bin2]MCR9111062.1 SDR family oxidoreductase [Paracoccaceae bacterium]PWL35977.1 MAG: oxidoreductase [Marivita sp. XM-24bin2]